MIQQRLTTIQNRINAIKQGLLQMGEMRPGSLTKQLQRRSSTDKVFAYWQLSYTHNMRSKTDYVRQDLVKQTRAQVKNFKRFKKLVGQWTNLAIEHARISNKLGKEN